MELIDAPAKIPLIKKFVKENYMKKITIAETAKKFFLSPGYFSHFFKKLVNRPEYHITGPSANNAGF